MKRLPRYDRSSNDILGIKRKLSEYANNVYDQLLLKSSYASNIFVVELNLEVQNSAHLRELIFGKQSSDDFDGVHLVGTGASRHFNYRAVQAMRSILSPTGEKVTSTNTRTQRCVPRLAVHRPENPHTAWNSYNYSANYDDHTNCEQARYMRSKMSYSEAVQGGPSYRTYKGGNIFNHLN